MIRMLSGRLVSLFDEGVVVDVHGVGYEVFISGSTLRQLSHAQEVTLHIYSHIREDLFHLFGFLSVEERQLFVQLIGVSGVGPKSALHIVDRGVQSVVEAVRGSDVAFFQAIPRLGKKTAQKVIVDLQPKLGASVAFSLTPLDSLRHDVHEALIGLGYDERSIQTVINDVDESMGLEAAIKQTLKLLGAKR